MNGPGRGNTVCKNSSKSMNVCRNGGVSGSDRGDRFRNRFIPISKSLESDGYAVSAPFRENIHSLRNQQVAATFQKAQNFRNHARKAADRNDDHQAIVDRFLDALLSVQHEALTLEYDEEIITKHLAAKSMSPLGSSNELHNNDETDEKEALPLRFESFDQYSNAYLPLIVYNVWAQLVVDYDEQSGDLLLPFAVHRVCTSIDGKFIELLLKFRAQDESRYAQIVPAPFSLINWAVLLMRTSECSSPSSLDCGEDTSPDRSSAPPQNSIVICDVSRQESRSPPADKTTDGKMALGFVESFDFRQKYYTVKLTNTEQNRAWFLSPDNNGSSVNRIIVLQCVQYLGPIMRNLVTLSKAAKFAQFVPVLLRPEIDTFRLNFEQSSYFAFHDNSPHPYNEQQRKAIVACQNLVLDTTDRHSFRIALIQGPPGTGKTATLAGIVKNILVNGVPCDRSFRMLICAPSNGAIDEIAKRLITHLADCGNFATQLRIVRIGQSAKLDSSIANIHLDALADAELAAWYAANSGEDESQYDVDFCMYARYGARYGFVEKKRGAPLRPPSMGELRKRVLRNAHVILSTLNSVQQKCMTSTFGDGDRSFRCLIVDEAGQCTEPELLMPLIYPVNKLILIGDHRQLPATVVSKAAIQLNFGRSMFERFLFSVSSPSSAATSETLNNDGMDSVDQTNNNRCLVTMPDFCVNNESDCVVTLCEQYRMRAEIAQFPSKRFYAGRLITNEGAGINSAISLEPYRVYNIGNSIEEDYICEREKAGHVSKCNRREATFIFRLVLSIFADLGFIIDSDVDFCNSTSSDAAEIRRLPAKLPYTIGVITFYTGQKEAIKSRLARFAGGMLLPHIDVNTVDAFQGRERDIVILSCVRAFDPDNPADSVGFVRSQQRMNVAITRAKSLLYLCLHEPSFRRDPGWSMLIDDAIERGLYRDQKCLLADEENETTENQNGEESSDDDDRKPDSISSKKAIKRPFATGIATLAQFKPSIVEKAETETSVIDHNQVDRCEVIGNQQISVASSGDPAKMAKKKNKKKRSKKHKSIKK